MANPLKNTVDARHIYFTSLLSGSRRSLPGCNSALDDITKYDEYLNTVLNYHLEKRCKMAAFESMKNISRQRNRTGEERNFECIEKGNIYSVLRRREFDHFIKSLDENDEWQEKEAELRERFLKVIPDMHEETNSPTDRKRSEQMEKKIKNSEKFSKNIEELSRNLLLGANIDHLQNENACNILLHEEMKNV